MAKFPWSPPLNKNDYLVHRGVEGPKFLYLSEWVLMAKHATTRGRAAFNRMRERGMLDEAEILEGEEGHKLALAFLKDHAHLFPELDEQGDCIVEGRFREEPVNRTPPTHYVCPSCDRDVQADHSPGECAANQEHDATYQTAMQDDS